MTKKDAIHSFFAYLKHFFTAWNTTGEGIHSPYLFRLVRFVLRDENAYYCFADIERQRQLLLQCKDILDVVDYGSQGSAEGTHVQRRVCDIARNHLESPKVGQMLFRLVNFMTQEQKVPLQIIELGTSLGITTSYLASVDSRNKVTTLEGSGEVLKKAKNVWKALKLENIEWHEGNIDYTLFKRARINIDLAYIDANHTYEATLRYADYLLPKISEKGVLIIDDIHYSKQMERAWEELKQDKRVTTSMDLYHVGLLFVNTCFLKRHYRIRI